MKKEAAARGVDLISLGIGDPAPALARAFASDGPCLVRVPIAATENVYPMVRPGAPNREMIDEAALQAGEDGGCDAAEAM